MSQVPTRRLVRIGLALVILQGCTESPAGPAPILRPLAGADIAVAAVTATVTLDGSAGVNPNNGIAVVSGTLTCSASSSIQLDVTLAQEQKLRRVSTVVEAADVMTIACTGKHFWSIALTAPSGGFQAGAATASVKAGGTDVTPTQVSGAVKLSWSRK